MDLAASLYGDSASTYQIKTIDGNKVAEYSTRAEVRNYLRKKDCTKYDVWHLGSRNGELKGIHAATDFINESISFNHS